jgi:hypothetical protein
MSTPYESDAENKNADGSAKEDASFENGAGESLNGACKGPKAKGDKIKAAACAPVEPYPENGMYTVCFLLGLCISLFLISLIA